MHCPECGQNYPEGSQRFCDVEGARLISPGDADYQRGHAGVFANILQVATRGSVPDTGIGLEPRFAVPDRRQQQTDADAADLFFEADEDDGIIVGDGEAVFEVAPAERTDERIFGRKVNPHEIPAGHIEVNRTGEGEYILNKNQDFNADDPQDFVGRRVKGRYRVTELLGEDDTGFAFLAEDILVDDKRVQVRILSHEELDDVTESIFGEERVTLSHINHPNVVRLIDSGQFVDGTTFLISEHLEALTVRDALQIHGPLDAGRTARIIRQAANALSEVHHEGILHRDLRPEFLVLAASENDSEIVKLSNFGVSDGGLSAENLHYIAPETLDGRIPTIAGDIYSLGVIAYRLLTGRMPFPGLTEREVLRSQRAGLETLPSGIRNGVSHEVDDVFGRVLALDPLERYSTAREFGEALYAALTTAPEAIIEHHHDTILPEVIADVVSTETKAAAVVPNARVVVIKPEIDDVLTEEAAWTRRSPEPPAEPGSNWIKVAVIGFTVLLAVAAGVWYYVLNRPAEPDFRVPTDTEAANPGNAPVAPQTTPEQATRIIEVPPLARTISQPPNSDFFQNTKQNLKGDLLRNFVGFSLFYPKDWKITGPQESKDFKSRGKFLDIAQNTPDGKLKEQMLVSYYPSNGTFKEDTEKFPLLVKETNDTLKTLIPNYQIVSEGSTTVNGGWNAYEIKFQGSGTTESGERLLVWGRRLFIPAARPGVRAGFEVTLLATSFADNVRSVDDVGIRGELAQIIYTFEPSQSF